jgi:hypothetical protein
MGAVEAGTEPEQAVDDEQEEEEAGLHVAIFQTKSNKLSKPN